MQPKISIVIPAYNEERHLSAALESIIKSNYPNLEILIGIDDGNDRTLEIAKSYAGRFRNISVIHHKKRVGVTRNINSLIRKAKGEIVLKFDADMRVGDPKTCFLRIARHFERSKVGGLAIIGFDKVSDNRLEREVNDSINRNFLTRGEYVAYRVVDMFKRENLPLNNIPNFPIDIQCFRKNALPRFTKNVVHDDAFFAFSVLKKGYSIELADDISIIHLGTPKSSAGLFASRLKGRAGWMELADEYRLNLPLYYLRLFLIFLKNIPKLRFLDVAAFIYWSIVFNYSLLISSLKRERRAADVWKAWSSLKE